MNEAHRLALLVAKRDELLKEANEASGAYKQCLERLKKEYGCNSLEEAKKQRIKLKKELDAIDSELSEKLANMEEEYADLLF